MSRNRDIYQCNGLYAGPSPATGAHFAGAGALYGSTYTGQATGANNVKQIFRVQSANYGYNIARRDVNQFGELAAIDRLILEQPTVSLEFTYLVQSVTNEKNVGFTVSSGAGGFISMISGILNKTSDEKNYFIRTTSEGNDLTAANVSTDRVIGVGNGFISSYTAEGSVGNFPTATIRVEGLNMEFDNNITGNNIPAVFPSSGAVVQGWYYTLPGHTQNPGGGTINTNDYNVSVIRPGDITLDVQANEGGADVNDLKIQRYTVGVNLSRQDLLKLGSKYAFSKEIQFPVTSTMSVVAEVGDQQTGSLVEIVNNNTSFSPSVTLKHPSDGNVLAYYKLGGAKLDSQQFSSAIGSNKTVTMNFSTQVGAPQNQTIGLFCSGTFV